MRVHFLLVNDAANQAAFLLEKLSSAENQRCKAVGLKQDTLKRIRNKTMCSLETGICPTAFEKSYL